MKTLWIVLALILSPLASPSVIAAPIATAAAVQLCPYARFDGLTTDDLTPGCTQVSLETASGAPVTSNYTMPPFLSVQDTATLNTFAASIDLDIPQNAEQPGASVLAIGAFLDNIVITSPGKTVTDVGVLELNFRVKGRGTLTTDNPSAQVWSQAWAVATYDLPGYRIAPLAVVDLSGPVDAMFKAQIPALFDQSLPLLVYFGATAGLQCSGNCSSWNVSGKTVVDSIELLSFRLLDDQFQPISDFRVTRESDSPVPEPGVFLLTSCGLAATGLARRFRRLR